MLPVCNAITFAHTPTDALFRLDTRCVALRCVALRCVALYCTTLHCIVLYCIVLYCIVLYCIVLYCHQRVDRRMLRWRHGVYQSYLRHVSSAILRHILLDHVVDGRLSRLRLRTRSRHRRQTMHQGFSQVGDSIY